MTARILACLALLVVLAAAAAGLIVYSGVYDVAASQPHYAPVRWVLSLAMTRSVQRHAAGIEVPALPEPRSGFPHYREHCTACHGAPGVDPGPIGRGLTPPPPDLARHAGHWSDAELFWIIEHGIKMTGMPAWGDAYTAEEIWSLVAFLRALPELSPAAYAALEQDAQAAPAAAVVETTGRLRFSPERIEIRAGETVEWRNASAIVHTVTADPGRVADPTHVRLPEGAAPFHSGDLEPGERFRHRFETPGEYRYVCLPHEAAGMLGTVVVERPPREP